MNQFKQKLIDLEACFPALVWVGDRTLEQAWAECDNLGWLEWVVCRLDLPKTELVNLACRAARSVLHLVPEGEDRPRLAIEAAERWLAEPTQENRHVASASAAAYRAASAAYSASEAYAAYAAYRAASAAEAAASAAYSASAAYAAYAASAAAYAAAYALCETEAKACDKFREFYPVELVKRGLGL